LRYVQFLNVFLSKDAIILAQRAQVDMDKSYNLGLTDLMAALVWVQLNAEHFGGDPRVVTLLGWGAGSSLVTAVTTIP
jgi:carboxylesterase type B